MARTKKYKVVYYQLQYDLLTVENTPQSLSTELKKLSDLEQFRSIEYYGMPIDIHRSGVRTLREGVLAFSLIGNQMDDIPPRHNQTTRTERSLEDEMGDDEGLGRAVSVLIDPMANILAIERRNQSATPAGVRSWLQHNLDLPALRLGLVIHPDSLERFMRLDKILKVDFALAKPERADAILPDSDYELFSAISRKSRDINFDQATISLQTDSRHSRGINRDSMSIQNSRGLINRLRVRSAEEVTKIKVFGYDGDVKEIIDLIEDKMEDQIVVNQPDGRFVRTFNTYEHQTAMATAYFARRNTILMTYGIELDQEDN